jgi:hypothetical protein
VRPAERLAVTSANVTLAELNAAADAYDLRLPPAPASGRWATLGGMVSTNAAGARSVRYGSVRQWVRAVELVTAAGETLELRRGGGSGDPGSATTRRFEAELAPAIRAAAPLIGARFPAPGRTPLATPSTPGSPPAICSTSSSARRGPWAW